MTLKQWCQYIDRDFLTSCEECQLCDACKCTLHCNYQTFSDLLALSSKVEVDCEMERMLNYYRATYPPSMPSLKGKYFWSMSCDGRGLYDR